MAVPFFVADCHVRVQRHLMVCQSQSLTILTVRLEQDAGLLRNGLRGRARVTVDTRSVGQWIWRYLLQTFHFRL